MNEFVAWRVCAEYQSRPVRRDHHGDKGKTCQNPPPPKPGSAESMPDQIHDVVNPADSGWELRTSTGFHRRCNASASIR